jgi:hypothetical protein
LLGFKCLTLQISLGDPFEIVKRLAPILTILDLCDLLPVDPKMPLAPRSDIYFKFVGSNGRDELVKGGALSNWKILIRLPSRFACWHAEVPPLPFHIGAATRMSIRTQLEAAKWQEFDDLKAAP